MESEKAAHGGYREGAGRKASENGKRDKNIGIRVSESELLMFREKARNAGMGLTEFIIHLVENA